MAHIPTDDVRQLFQENKEKSWSGLHKVLQQHRGKAEGIEDAVVTSLIMLTRRMMETNQPYPLSSEEMQRMLDSELTKMTA